MELQVGCEAQECVFLEKDESFNLIFLHFCTFPAADWWWWFMVQPKVGRGVPECYTQLSSKRGGEKPAKFTRCTWTSMSSMARGPGDEGWVFPSWSSSVGEDEDEFLTSCCPQITWRQRVTGSRESINECWFRCIFRAFSWCVQIQAGYLAFAWLLILFVFCFCIHEGEAFQCFIVLRLRSWSIASSLKLWFFATWLSAYRSYEIIKVISYKL